MTPSPCLCGSPAKIVCKDSLKRPFGVECSRDRRCKQSERVFRKSEDAAVRSWNRFLARMSEPPPQPGERCRCGLLLPCFNCPSAPGAIIRTVLSRSGESAPASRFSGGST